VQLTEFHETRVRLTKRLLALEVRSWLCPVGQLDFQKTKTTKQNRNVCLLDDFGKLRLRSGC
jgi:hypothetical protein